MEYVHIQCKPINAICRGHTNEHKKSDQIHRSSQRVDIWWSLVIQWAWRSIVQGVNKLLGPDMLQIQFPQTDMNLSNLAFISMIESSVVLVFFGKQFYLQSCPILGLGLGVCRCLSRFQMYINAKNPCNVFIDKIRFDHDYLDMSKL